MRTAVSDTMETMRHDIESALRRRTTRPNSRARVAEDAAKRGGSAVWRMLERHSYMGVLAFGTAGVVVADLIGVGELAFGVMIAYGAFRVLRRGESPSQAVEEVVREVGRAE
jgi:hypothetical protein